MTDDARARRNAARRTVAMTVIGAYLLISPLFPQLLDTGRPFVRQWTMFSGVGIGVLKGEFRFTDEAGAETRLSPLDVLDLQRYPLNAQFYRFQNLIRRDEDFTRIAAAWCAANPERRGELSFAGKLGHGKSWREVEFRESCGAGA